MAKSQSKLIEKIESALEAKLHDFRSGLMRGVQHERVIGFVVSSDFKPNMDHSARQAKLSRILEAALTPEEMVLVGPIATFTPAEADISRKAG